LLWHRPYRSRVNVAFEQLIPAVTEDFHMGIIQIDEAPVVETCQADGYWAGVKDRREPLFGLPQGFFRFFALGYIAVDADQAYDRSVFVVHRDRTADDPSSSARELGLFLL